MKKAESKILLLLVRNFRYRDLTINLPTYLFWKAASILQKVVTW